MGFCGESESGFGTDISGIVDRLAEHIHNAAERLLANRDRDRPARVADGHASLQALARAHRDRAYHTIAQLLLNFERQSGFFQEKRIVNLGNGVPREYDIYDSANNLHGCSCAHK